MITEKQRWNGGTKIVRVGRRKMRPKRGQQGGYSCLYPTTMKSCYRVEP